ncbi:MAG: hypothetical protein KKF44_01555 [Nanoarchaeota archaeon]|nr:hypothetical protein [Nanoarchaeota archaeon]
MASEKKNLSESLTSTFNIIGNLIETIIEHTDGEVKRIKKKVLHIFFLAGFLLISVLFMLIGLAKILPDIINISEGASFLIIGSVLVVSLSLYSMFHNL